MVLIHEQECQEKPVREEAQRPQLVLCDVSAAPRRVRRSTLRQWEDRAFAAAAAAVALFFVGSGVAAIQHSLHPASAPVIISKTVKPGDTLWKYAALYGDKNTYMPARVDEIARDNHFTAGVPLIPGQHIKIPVHNPIVLAQLQHHTLVAHR